jgi:GMP synthase (glutamine-hydrolysing)
MICHVDIEHDSALRDEEKRVAHFGRRVETKYRLEEISGHPCLLQRYWAVTLERLAEWKVEALLISGNTTDWAGYAAQGLTEMFRIIRAAPMPILGFCGGGQLIAMAHGAAVGPMRRLRADETDQDTGYHPGFFKERGHFPLRVLNSDPILDGLGSEPVVWQSHYWEMRELPSGFELLASTEQCRIQLIRQTGKPIYGCQFHPEKYTAEHPDGKTLLSNFFRVSGIQRK